MMGAHFRTGGTAPFFGFPISELTSHVVELDLIWKREIVSLREQLIEAKTVDGKFDLLEAYLIGRAHSPPGAGQDHHSGSGNAALWPVIPLRELASRLGVSHKQMIARLRLPRRTHSPADLADTPLPKIAGRRAPRPNTGLVRPGRGLRLLRPGSPHS